MIAPDVQHAPGPVVSMEGLDAALTDRNVEMKDIFSDP